MEKRRLQSRGSHPPLSPSPTPTPPLSKKEWVAIVGITLLGAALRLAYPERMAIEHFDEGVYASNIFFSEAQGGAYPYRYLYAPPLLPWLIEWGIVFLGTESIAPFLPALVLGMATVPLMWWVGRSWFGPLAGLAAALLVATSEFHILYSRAALTDVPVMFFIVLAVYLYAEAVRRLREGERGGRGGGGLAESVRWSIFAGVATGLAWWTKYTGWLPLAIAGAGSAAWVLGDLRFEWKWMRARAWNAARCWGVMAMTAFVVWSPVLYGLQEHGGYAAVAENHAGYLISGPGGWFENVLAQVQKTAILSGLVTGLGLAVVVGLMPLAMERTRWWDWVSAGLLAISVFLATASLGPVFAMGVLAVAGLLLEAFWRLRRRFDGASALRGSSLGLWLLTAWLVGMTLATPFYMPYPRLMFPWLLGAIFLCARWLANSKGTRVPREGWSQAGASCAVILLLMPGTLVTLDELVDSIPHLGRDVGELVDSRLWEDRTGAEQAAETFAELIRQEYANLDAGDKAIVAYVYGQPAIFYYLRAKHSGENVAVLATGSPRVFDGPVPGHTTFVIIKLDTLDELRDGTLQGTITPTDYLLYGDSRLVKLDSPNADLLGKFRERNIERVFVRVD